MKEFRVNLINRMESLYGTGSEEVTEFTELCEILVDAEIFDKNLEKVVEIAEKMKKGA